MKNCLGIINLDEKEMRMGELVRNRSLASVPMAGRYRIIDFVLSNMANSEIDGIGIFAKNKSRSLINHLTNGRPWDLHRNKDGLRVFNFGDFDPEVDDVHNFLENMEFIKESNKDYVLLAPAYMICNINYKQVIKAHKKSKRDITIVYKNSEEANKKFINCEVLNIDKDNRIRGIGENIGTFQSSNISMEMYVIKIDLFIDIVYECIRNGMYRKVKDYIKSNLDKLDVGAYEFNGYLACINSVQEYFKANMDLLDEEINKELFFDKNPIYTKSQDEAPTQYTPQSNVVNSIVANGSFIEGNLENCIVGRRVHVAEGVTLKDCIIMQNSVIKENTKMDYVITDKGSVIESNQNILSTVNSPIVIEKTRVI